MHTMPLMSLAATAIDQPKERSKVIESLLRFIHTDSTCCRYEPGRLANRQALLLDPILKWIRKDLGWDMHITHSIAGTTQPDATLKAAEQLLQGLDNWELAAVEQLSAATKSLVLSMAALREHLTVSHVIAAARLEEDFQCEEWGKVEAGHDLDIADIRTRIYGASLFLRLLKNRQQ